jgi:hypothetical protein
MPISAEVIERNLLKTGFIRDHDTSKKRRFISKFGEYVYINKTSGDQYSTLIIHPRFRDKYSEFLKISGVSSNSSKGDPFYHSAHMSKFPKRKNNGKEEIHYGIPFGFDNQSAFEKFLNLLLNKVIIPDEANYSETVNKSPQTLPSTDEIDDIEAVKESLAAIVNDTERNAVVKSRIGQGIFRELLIQHWGACSVTGMNFVPILRASHIKPWSVSSNEERLDPENGLLLTPNLDVAFDRGFISFSDDGDILISSELSVEIQTDLGIHLSMKLSKISNGNRKYLNHHRNSVFKN